MHPANNFKSDYKLRSKTKNDNDSSLRVSSGVLPPLSCPSKVWTVPSGQCDNYQDGRLASQEVKELFVTVTIFYDIKIYGIWFIHVCEGGTLLRHLKTFLWTRTSIQVLETSNLVLSSATITIFFTLILMFNILKWPVTNGTGQVLSYALYIVSFKGSALINGTHVISISYFA